MDRTYRIGWLFEHPTLSGGERSALEMLSRLAPPYDPVALAPREGPLADALARIGCRHVPLTISRRTSDIDTLVRRLEQTAAEEGLDLLHANTLSTADLTGPASTPSVGHIREIGRISAARMARLQGNTLLLAVSDAVARNLTAQGAPAPQVRTCYNGIDLDHWNPARWRAAGQDLRSRLGPARLLLAIGQLGPRKGQDLLLDAFAALSTPAELWIVGQRWSAKQESIEYERALHERAAASAQPVRLLGYREDVPALLAAADLLVHPARQEPLGRVILEAMAMDCPVIATAVGGSPEMLDPAQLIAPEDARALEQALAAALARPRTGGLRTRCRERFSARRALQALRDIYDGILSSCR